VVGLVALTGCFGSNDVDWKNYPAGLKQRIDTMGDLGDCAGLQSQFNNAADTDAAQRARVGDGNGDLKIYIRQKMKHCPSGG
jgi:hypothetical protein